MRLSFFRRPAAPLAGALLLLAACKNTPVPQAAQGSNGSTATPASLSGISVPPGFSIAVFAEVPGARSLCRGNKALFVGTMSSGKVYAVTDTDNDGIADKVYTLASGLNSPNGVAFRDGNLYVAEINRILRFDDIENHLDNPPAYKVIYDKLPTEGHHGWKFIAFGPDGKLYVPVGAPCNICLPDSPYAAINRMNPDGSGFETFARGVRNTVGFDWDPSTKELWFTDNGRDNLGDSLPSDELNHAPRAGMHFGYPFCHQGDTPDPEFGKQHSCSEFTPPEVKLGAHVASLGLRFYTGNQFPDEYHNAIFLAEHGSWNRTVPDGYRVMSVRKVNGQLSLQPFATGWLGKDGNATGRPVDVCLAPDGALLVSDDKGGKVYRISYRK